MAAEALASMSSSAEVLEQGRLFPPFSRIMDVSVRVMAAVCDHMVTSGLGLRPAGVRDASQWEGYCRAHMWGRPQASRM